MDELTRKTIILRDIKLFEKLTLDVIQKIAQNINFKKMIKGEVIFSEGDEPDGFYVVDDGKVSIQKKGQEIALLTKNDFFGENGLITNKPRLTSAIAKDDGMLLYLDNATFNVLIDHHQEILWIMINKVLADLQQEERVGEFSSQKFYNKKLETKKILPKDIKTISSEMQRQFNELRQIPIFEELNHDELSAILEMVEWCYLKKGEIIFLEGDVSDYFYILIDGSVVLRKNHVNIVINKHDFFGELGVISDKFRMASAMTAADSVLIRMNKSNFEKLLASHPSTAKYILFKIVSYRG